MTRRLAIVAAAAMIVVSGVSPAHAQRGYRSGPAMTPYGPVYNPTLSPDYRLYASNPAGYEQLMMQRQMQAANQQQQAALKQQQQFQKWLKDQKAKKDKGQPTDPAYDQLVKAQEAQTQAALKASLRRTARRSGANKKGSSTKKSAAAPPAAVTGALAATKTDTTKQTETQSKSAPANEVPE